ncbi:MAG: hypothetical protein ACE5NP_08455, partial [Anaerolineae bacterium]
CWHLSLNSGCSGAHSLAVAAFEAYIREQKLKEQIQQLRIEIDEVKKAKQAAEITETEYFRGLREHAAKIKRRMNHEMLEM